MQTQLSSMPQVGEPLPLQLKWCRTFIDVGDDDSASSGESGSSKRRSQSEPAHQKLAEAPAELFGGERAYIASLASKLVCFREHYKSNSRANSSASTASQGCSDKNSMASFCAMSTVSSSSDLDFPAVMSPCSPSAPSQPRSVQKPGVVLEIAQLLRDTTDSRCELNTNELVAQSLLRAKAQGSPRPASSVEGATEVELPDPAEVLMLSPSATQACNPGSLGHPELCMRPCIYFATGGCSNGESCEYCHMGHPKRPVHLDKRHREMLRGMSMKETAGLLYPVVRSKVEVFQRSAAVDELLHELAWKCGSDPTCREPVTVNRQQRMLLTTLKSMSLRSLLTTFGRVLSEVSNDGEAVIDQLLRQVRRGLTA
mmetsp:Transcript_75433/g.164564  ORF Transcript_75433/g.164564 Transcript_75433/m.164564 type:complete len:370 (-) Transcript_75433:181-1290(-)